MEPNNCKILILGAGLVAQPMVKYFLSKDYKITIASNTPDRAKVMANNNANASIIDWDIEDKKTLEDMVSSHNIVISLLPYIYHVNVAEFALKHKVNMLTTSYVSPALRALDEEAKKQNIIILNECGLDPGIDHMSTMRIVDNVKNRGGEIEEFYSLCGALPAPEALNNPFNYKFSWSPRGVVLASNNGAKYLKKGNVVELGTDKLFKDIFQYNFKGIGEFDVYPNRDSISYADIYGIESVKTIFRGTFRYKGWCQALDKMKELKLLSNDKVNISNKTYSQMMAMLTGNNSDENIKQKTATYLNISIDSIPMKAMDFLGLFDSKSITANFDNTFDVTADLMISKMILGDNERDMVALQHVFVAKHKDGTKEVIKSRLLDFGTPATDTSIARTVALPASIAVEMILQNKIQLKGVHIPVVPEIYNPILDALEKIGITMVEEYGLPLSEAIN